MKCLVNWNLLRIRVDSKNTQSYPIQGQTYWEDIFQNILLFSSFMLKVGEYVLKVGEFVDFNYQV